MKRILIINPDNPLTSEFSAKEPPVWAGLYASYARSLGYEVRIHDCQERPNNDVEYAPNEVWIIAMGNNPSASSTPKMLLAKEISQRWIDWGVKVKIGGLHASALPTETIQECGCDSILPMIKPIDYQVAWDLLPMDIYRAHNWHCLHDMSDRYNYASIYTAYGCPFSCDFCNIRQLYGVGTWMPRTTGSVISEMDKLKTEYGVRNLKICDELFTVSPKRTIALCERMEDFKFNIWAYGRVGTTNPGMLYAMKKAGVNWVAYGFESFDSWVRGNKKYGNESETIKMTRDAGINIMGNLIFGLPGDTEDSMKYTLEKAMKYNFEYVNFYIAMPYPGSLLWNDKLSHDWSRYSQFSSNPMAVKQATEFRDRAFIEYFTNPDYINMIQKKFGGDAVEHIRTMLKVGKPKCKEVIYAQNQNAKDDDERGGNAHEERQNDDGKSQNDDETQVMAGKQ